MEQYNFEYDLIFMDIKMNRLNGFKTAEEIRKADSAVGLVFLTSLSQYVFKGYEYHASNYLLKPLKYNILKLELDRYFSHYQGKDEPYFSFSNHNGKYKVLYKNLCSFDKFHYILLATNNQELFANFSKIFFLHLVTNYFII